MKGLVRRAALIATAVGAVLGMTVSSALAGGTASWTVTPAGAYTAHADYPMLESLYALWECESVDVSAGAFNASSVTGQAIGSIDAVTSSGCSVGGWELALTANSAPWSINVVGPSSSNPNWVDITVSDVSANYSGISCEANFSGTLHGHYENDTGSLVIDGAGSDLIAFNTGCLGLINDGDEVVLAGTFHVSASVTGQSPVIS